MAITKDSVKVLVWDEKNNILLVTVKNKVYKAKLVKHNDHDVIYLLNTQKAFAIEHKKKNALSPSDMTKAKSSFFESSLKSPLAGRVTKMLVKTGQAVTKNQPLIIIESMKMDNEICATCNALVKTISISEGNLVQPDQVLISFEKREEKREEEGEKNASSKNRNVQEKV